MFREWGFLKTEMMGLIILAALLGLFAGWLIWSRRKTGSRREIEMLERALGKCNASHREKDDRIHDLQLRLESCEADLAYYRDTEERSPENNDQGYDGDGLVKDSDEGAKPMPLDAPRRGAPEFSARSTKAEVY